MQSNYKFITNILLLSALVSTSAIAAEEILTNKVGMTLYTFDKDSKGQSNCNGGCAAKWPPYTAGANAKANNKYDIITRKDGSKQWSYDGEALYTWIGDTKKGDTKGDGVGGVWHTAVKADSKYSY